MSYLTITHYQTQVLAKIIVDGNYSPYTNDTHTLRGTVTDSNIALKLTWGRTSK